MSATLAREVRSIELPSIYEMAPSGPFMDDIEFKQPNMAKRHAAAVPNRLFGTTINEDGDAV